MIKIILFLSLLLLVYPYIIYPIILKVCTKNSKDKQVINSKGYNVDILIPVYNEEKVIKSKLLNLKEMEYDRNKFRVIIGTDGCTDNSVNIIQKFILDNPDIRIVLKEFKENRGKSTLLNELFESSTAEILVFTDASTIFNENTIEELTNMYHDKSIIGISGNKMMSQDDETDTGASEGVYWKFESYLKKLESQFHSVIGFDGPVFSIRRESFQKIPHYVILDDFYIAMKSVSKKERIVYNKNAIGFEKSSETYNNEYIRRKRLATGAYQYIKFMLKEKIFIKWGAKVMYCFISHKMIRWLSPIFMISLYISNLMLYKESFFFSLLLIVQTFLYLASAVMHLSKYKILGNGKFATIIYSLSYFIITNFLQIFGLYNGIFKKSSGKWKMVNR